MDILAAAEICGISKRCTLVSCYTFMPRSSTTSVFYCQTPSSPLGLLEFKAAARSEQSAVWDRGCSQTQPERFGLVGNKASAWQRVSLFWGVREILFFSAVSVSKTWLARAPCIILNYSKFFKCLSPTAAPPPWFVSAPWCHAVQTRLLTSHK